MLDRTFRPYEPDQLLPLPPSPGEWLPEDHLASVLSDLADEFNLNLNIPRSLSALFPGSLRAYVL